MDAKHRNLLRTKRVELLDDVQPSEKLLSYLFAKEVLSKESVEEIKAKDTRLKKVAAMLDHIPCCGPNAFQGFVEGLFEDGQKHLADELDKSIADPDRAHIPHRETETDRAIHHHSKGCRKMVMKRNMYDLRDHQAAEPLNTADCYVPIKLKMKDTNEKTTSDISEKEMFSPLQKGDPPNTLLLSGPVGGGKSSLASHLVYDWSGRVIEASKDSSCSPTRTEDFSLMVFVKATDIKTTVDDAIRDSLCCKKGDEKLLMKHIENEKGVVIDIDGVDEISNKEVMDKLKTYVHEIQSRRGPQVLLTARTNLCSISSRSFDRFLSITGFDVSQGKTYVERFFSMDTLTHKVTLDEMKTYVDEHEEKLYPVLTNPLRLHMFCAMMSRGYLKLTEGANFSIPKLFGALEKCLLARENVELLEPQLEDFYRYCMYGLMSGKQEFCTSSLDEFGIDERCRDIFLQKKLIQGPFGETADYSFPHQMFYEYFAGKYIDTLPLDGKKNLILAVCQRRELRNVQRIIGELISQNENHREELLGTMIQCILFLHYKGGEEDEKDKEDEENTRSTSSSEDEENTRRQPRHVELVALRDSIKALNLIDDMKSSEYGKGQSDNVHLAEINNVFDNDAKVLQSEGWAGALLNDGILTHVVQCLAECSPGLRENILSSTVHKLLPTTYTDTYGDTATLHPVGGTRWCELSHSDGDYWISAWCTDDVREMLVKHNKTRKVDTTRNESVGVGLYIDKYRDEWGIPGDTTWSHDTWVGVLSVVTQVCGAWIEVGIHVDKTTRLTGLLTAIPRVGTQGGEIVVLYGTICMNEVITFVDWCKHTRTRLLLEHTRIVIPDGERLDIVREKRNKLCETEEHGVSGYGWYGVSWGVLSWCDWVTTDGAVYNWDTQTGV